jgi:hypothetical protein
MEATPTMEATSAMEATPTAVAPASGGHGVTADKERQKT